MQITRTLSHQYVDPWKNKINFYFMALFNTESCLFWNFNAILIYNSRGTNKCLNFPLTMPMLNVNFDLQMIVIFHLLHSTKGKECFQQF